METPSFGKIRENAVLGWWLWFSWMEPGMEISDQRWYPVGTFQAGSIFFKSGRQTSENIPLENRFVDPMISRKISHENIQYIPEHGDGSLIFWSFPGSPPHNPALLECCSGSPFEAPEMLGVRGSKLPTISQVSSNWGWFWSHRTLLLNSQTAKLIFWFFISLISINPPLSLFLVARLHLFIPVLSQQKCGDSCCWGNFTLHSQRVGQIQKRSLVIASFGNVNTLDTLTNVSQIRKAWWNSSGFPHQSTCRARIPMSFAAGRMTMWITVASPRTSGPWSWCPTATCPGRKRRKQKLDGKSWTDGWDKDSYLS